MDLTPLYDEVSPLETDPARMALQSAEFACRKFDTPASAGYEAGRALPTQMTDFARGVAFGMAFVIAAQRQNAKTPA